MTNTLDNMNFKPSEHFNLTGMLIVCLLLISSCSSDSNTTSAETTENDPADDVNAITRIGNLSESVSSFEGVTRIGWFEIDESDQIQIVDSAAAFVDVGAGNSLSNLVTSYLSTPGDTCIVEPRNPEPQRLLFNLSDTYQTVSVGEVITMFEVGAPFKYSELAHLGLATEGRYINYLDLPYPSPTSLSISAVGEVFSAFSLTVDKPAAITALSIVNGQPIPSGSTITWAATDDSDTMLNIRLEESTDDFATFVINCTVVDDGEFTLPANLDVGAGANTILQVATRQRVGSTRVNNDQVIMMRSTSVYRQF